MKWVTRERVKVDRVACPWLIKHFIDPDAEFLFVPSDQVTDVARRTGAIPYDVEGAELGHVEGRCSGFSLLYPDDDHRILAEEFRVYDALYAWCRQKVGAA